MYVRYFEMLHKDKVQVLFVREMLDIGWVFIYLHEMFVREMHLELDLQSNTKPKCEISDPHTIPALKHEYF